MSQRNCPSVAHVAVSSADRRVPVARNTGELARKGKEARAPNPDGFLMRPRARPHNRCIACTRGAAFLTCLPDGYHPACVPHPWSQFAERLSPSSGSSARDRSSAHSYIALGRHESVHSRPVPLGRPTRFAHPWYASDSSLDVVAMKPTGTHVQTI